MIPSKYKSAHYLHNRFKDINEIDQWFERQDAIYPDDEILELWKYFKRQCEKDLVLLAECSDDIENREIKIVNTADFLRYCHNNIQKTLRNNYQCFLNNQKL